MRSWLAVLLATTVLITAVVPATAQARRRLAFGDVAPVVLRENLQLRAAALDVAIAKAQLDQARSGARPLLGVTTSYSRAQERAGQALSFANPFGSTPATITVTLRPPDPDLVALRLRILYPLYTGGWIESQIVLAEANLRGAPAVFTRATQQVVFAAQQAYLRVLLSDGLLNAARRSLDQAQEQVRVAQTRVAAGASPTFDVLQAQLAEAEAQQAVARAEAATQNASAGLNLLLNLPLDQEATLTDVLERRRLSSTLTAAIARGLRERPELAELRARMDVARAAIELARSGGRPNVLLDGTYNLGGSLSAATGSWSGTLAVTLSLHDGGLTRERVREAEARLAQVQLLEADRRRTIELEVRRAWLALTQAEAEITATSAGVAQAREAVRLADLRYKAGVGTSLETVAAQAALAQAEAAAVQTLFNHSLARGQMERAVGGPLE